MDPVGDPSPSSRRSVKRRPPARSPELSPKAGGGEEAELIRRLEELEEAAARLRGEKEAAEEAARGLQAELEAERVSAETATSEAMLMIERLQREKAAAQMEARQFRRYAEGRADREREVQEELASLSDLAASYHSRLQSHGIDPDSFSDDEEEVDQDEEEGEEVQQIDTAAMEADRSSGGSSSFMQVKAMVDDDEEEQFTPVEKEFEYTVDVRCASTTTKVSGAVVVGEYVGESNVGGLYARVEALEANRAAMRSEIAALRAERAQLVMARARAMARRLCWEVVAEQKAKKKVAASSRSFSVLGVCKWVLSIIFWRNRSSAARYTFGLSTTFLGFLLLLDRSTMLSPWCRLPRPER